jgi:hypothetical protein
MRDRRELAKLALALVEGSLTVGEAADRMFLNAFASTEEAVVAHDCLADSTPPSPNRSTRHS